MQSVISGQGFSYMPGHSPANLGYDVLFTDGHAGMIYIDKNGREKWTDKLYLKTLPGQIAAGWFNQPNIHTGPKYTWIPEVP